MASEPEVAVTVTVDVTGWVLPPPPDDPPPDDPLPHAVRRLSPIAVAAKRAKSWRRRRFLRPKQEMAAASSASGNSGPERR